MNAVLVTGASGFIGQALLRALLEQAPDRPLVLAGRSLPTAPLPAACRHLRLDLRDSAIALPEGLHTVLHLAGEKRDVTRMDAVNHLGAVRLVDAAARAGVRRVVHLSSVGVYGARTHAGVVDETHVHHPRNAYETSKDAGEQAVRARCAALGLACTVLQPSNVVGIVAGRGMPLLGLARMIARGWFCHVGTGQAWVNYVALDDVAGALAAAALRADAPQGVFIVNTPAPLAQLVGWMAAELGVAAPRRTLPLWLGALAGGAGAVGRVLLRRELPFSPERLRELTNTTRYDGSALARAPGFGYPLGIEAAVRTMMRRYRCEGLV
jgi:nucleoside-diphosphate-sugar epimerase